MSLLLSHNWNVCIEIILKASVFVGTTVYLDMLNG